MSNSSFSSGEHDSRSSDDDTSTSSSSSSIFSSMDELLGSSKSVDNKPHQEIVTCEGQTSTFD